METLSFKSIKEFAESIAKKAGNIWVVSREHIIEVIDILDDIFEKDLENDNSPFYEKNRCQKKVDAISVNEEENLSVETKSYLKPTSVIGPCSVMYVVGDCPQKNLDRMSPKNEIILVKIGEDEESQEPEIIENEEGSEDE